MVRAALPALLLSLAAACSDRPPTPEEQLARFPGATEVSSQETRDMQEGLPLPGFLLPAETWIGHGLAIPVGEPHEDGSHSLQRVGVWTLRYVADVSGTHEEQGLLATGSFQQGLESGPWRFGYPDGGRLAAGEFVEGRMHGDWTVWTGSGDVDDARSGRYERGERIGPGVGFAATGSVLPLLAAAAAVLLAVLVGAVLLVRRRR